MRKYERCQGHFDILSTSRFICYTIFTLILPNLIPLKLIYKGGKYGSRRTQTGTLPAVAPDWKRRYGRGLPCRRFAPLPASCHQSYSLGSKLLPKCGRESRCGSSLPARGESHSHAGPPTHFASL